MGTPTPEWVTPPHFVLGRQQGNLECPVEHSGETTMCTQTAVMLTCINIIFGLFSMSLICPLHQLPLKHMWFINQGSKMRIKDKWYYDIEWF